MNTLQRYLFALIIKRASIQFLMGSYVLYLTNNVGLSIGAALSVNACFLVSSALFEVLTGYLADRFGHLKSVKLGALIRTFSIGMYTVFPSYLGVVIAEILDGLGGALSSGSDKAILQNKLSSDELGRVLKQVELISHIAGAGCALIGGYVGVTFGHQYPFIMTTVVYSIATVMLWLLKPSLETARIQNKPQDFQVAIKEVIQTQWRFFLMVMCTQMFTRFTIMTWTLLVGKSFPEALPIIASLNMVSIGIGSKLSMISTMRGLRGVILLRSMAMLLFAALIVSNPVVSLVGFLILEMTLGSQYVFEDQYCKRIGSASWQASINSVVAMCKQIGSFVGLAGGIVADVIVHSGHTQVEATTQVIIATAIGLAFFVVFMELIRND